MEPPEPSSKEIDWHTVKQEIIEEIRKDLRSKEILGGLEESDWKSKSSKIFQHPAVLVLLTFLFTGFVGTQLTNSWQTKQRKLSQKYEIVDHVNKAVSDNLTATQDIVGLYQYEQGASNRIEIEKERWDYWQQKSRELRVNANLIQQRLKGNFKDPEIQRIFKELLAKSLELSVTVKNLKDEVGKNWELVTTSEFNKRLTDILDVVQSVKGLLEQMLDRASDEIDIGWWGWLKRNYF